MTAMTTRLIPASTRLCRQGGVRPWWLQGSRVTTAVASAASGGRGESLSFGVRFAFALVVSLADDPVLGIEQHAADRRVRARRAKAGGGQCDGASHGGDFGG